MTYPALEAARAEKRSEGDTAFLQAELFMKAEEMNDTHHVPIVVHGIVSVSDFKDEKEPSPVVASYLSFAKDFADSSLRGRVGKAARKISMNRRLGLMRTSTLKIILQDFCPHLQCPQAASNI